VSFSFNPARALVRVRAEITGPTGAVVVNLALDTGAVATVISSTRLILPGYDPASFGSPVRLTTASQIVQAFRLPVLSLTALGQTRSNLLVAAHNLPASASVDGVLGLDFLRGHILTIDFVKGEITLTSGGANP
jgi:hypothetical protein